MKGIDDWHCFLLTYSLPEFRLYLSNFPFNFVQGRDVVRRFLGNPALVGRVQIEELSARMGHTTDVSDTIAVCRS